MKWFLFIVSLIWITVGCCAILYTDETRNAVRSLTKKTNRKMISILTCIAGILFLFSAPVSRFPWIIRLFGLTGIAKGVFIFVNPKGLYDKFFDWYLDSLSDQTHRFYGIVTIIFGTAVMSWIL